MQRTRLFGWPSGATILVALAWAAFAIVAIRSLREPFLRAAGWALVVSEPVAPSETIAIRSATERLRQKPDPATSLRNGNWSRPLACIGILLNSHSAM
jgi:hypothetical protein